MKKILCIALAAMMLFVFAGCQKEAEAPKNSLDKVLSSGKLILGTSPDFAPYEFIDVTKTGQESYVGADIELAKYIAQELGVELEVQAMDFAAVMAAVQQGTVDIGISGFAWKQDRADAMDLSVTFNAGAYQGLLVRTEDADKYKTLADFNGKKVAVQNGSLQHDLLSQQIPEAIPEMVATTSDGIMMLVSGKVDAVGMSGGIGDQYAKNNDDIVMSEALYEYTSLGNVACLKKGSPELLARVNEIIAEAEASGKYAQWVAECTTLADELSAQ